jgi:hypothetical protein
MGTEMKITLLLIELMTGRIDILGIQIPAERSLLGIW